MVAPVNCEGCPYVVPVGTLSLVAIFPIEGIFTKPFALSFTNELSGTVITNNSVGQLEVWPGAHTGTV